MDKYVVEELLGVGGMGAVVAARRSWDGVRVALKVMLAAEAKHQDSTRRFFREARAAGVIDSPHVAKLLDFGRLEDGTPFMVLELLHGEGLDEIIRYRAPMPIPEAVDLILQAAEGIAEAHARGIVHRDIKPSNLHVSMATDGTQLLKVLDFGISKAIMKFEQGTDAPALTETNATLGSPQYMSPEQLKSSKDVDARTDIWSLGLILYKMLTGRPAFEAPNVGAHFAMILADPPTRLRQRRKDAPAELEEVISMCLEKECDRRWQDLGQLAHELAPFGPPTAPVRAERIAAILNFAGVSSTSRPRVVRPDDPTVRDAPRSLHPPELDITLPRPPPMPADLEPSSTLTELTKSAWTPGQGSISAPGRRARAAMVAAGVVALVLLAFGAGRMLQDETTTALAAAPTPTPSEPTATKDERKARWLAKVRAGTATPAELRKLEALCVLDGDETCVKAAKAARAPIASASAATPPSSASSEAAPKGRARPRPTTTEPPSGAQPDPKPAIKPKGPMVETL